MASVATATYYLKAIDDKLSTIQANTKDIINFLKADRQAEIQNDFDILREISSEIAEIKANGSLCLSTLKIVKDIIRTQRKNILSYEKIFGSLLQAYKTSKGKKREEKANELGQDYQYYRLSIQVYAMAKVIEIELADWNDITHLTNLREEFKRQIDQFKSIHDILLDTAFTEGKAKISIKSLLTQFKAYQKMGKITKNTSLEKVAEKKQKEARRKALSDAFKILGEKKIGCKGLEKVYSIEKHKSIEPLLEIVSSMETAYSNPMRMIVCGDDIYLQIEKEKPNSAVSEET